mgnify:CR=1 FL=1
MVKTVVGDTSEKVREFFNLVKQYVDANVWKIGPCIYEIEADGELEVREMRECTIVTGPYQLRVDTSGIAYIEDVRTYNRIAMLTGVEVLSCYYREGMRLVLKIRGENDECKNG